MLPRAVQVERVFDVARLIVHSSLPCGPGGEVCVDADLYERLAAAVYAEPDA